MKDYFSDFCSVLSFIGFMKDFFSDFCSVLSFIGLMKDYSWISESVLSFIGFMKDFFLLFFDRFVLHRLYEGLFLGISVLFWSSFIQLIKSSNGSVRYFGPERRNPLLSRLLKRCYDSAHCFWVVPKGHNQNFWKQPIQHFFTVQSVLYTATYFIRLM